MTQYKVAISIVHSRYGTPLEPEFSVLFGPFGEVFIQMKLTGPALPPGVVLSMPILA